MFFRLGVNIDHIATLRNARSEGFPNLLDLALLLEKNGAKQITAHLREDRRHINDQDIQDLKQHLNIPLNMEMAVTEEMIDIASSILPDSVCLVPEKREEITTEGGLDLISNFDLIEFACNKLKDKGIKISLFLDPNKDQIEKSFQLQPFSIEINTGKYSRLSSFLQQKQEADEISLLANIIADKGIKVHAGHGLNLSNISHIAKITKITEFNIGHYIISKALEVGLIKSFQLMNQEIKKYR